MAPLTYHSKDVFNIVRNERGGANVIFTGNELTDGFWLQTKLWGPTPGLILGAFQTKIRRWKTPQFQKTPQVHGHTSQVLFVHTQDFTSVLLSDQIKLKVLSIPLLSITNSVNNITLTNKCQREWKSHQTLCKIIQN